MSDREFRYGILRKFTISDDSVKLEYTDLDGKGFSSEDVNLEYGIVPKTAFLKETSIPIKDIECVGISFLSEEDLVFIHIGSTYDISLIGNPRLGEKFLESFIQSFL